MKKRVVLAIAMSASLVSLGVLAADKTGDQSGNPGANANSNSVITAQNGGMSFGDLDSDNDGKISWGEANMDPTVTERFSQYDRNGDEFIDSSEFSAVGAGPSGGTSNSESQNGSSSLQK